MRTSKTHIAFLVDEYGGFSGIVTTEDLIEEVMGEISDEHDEPEPGLEQVEDGVWAIDGGCYLEDLNDELGLHLESDDYETVGGLLIDRLGEISEKGSGEKQVVLIDGCRFTIESWKDRRIESIRLELLPGDLSETPEDAVVTVS
jgi:putative hemolysin